LSVFVVSTHPDHSQRSISGYSRTACRISSGSGITATFPRSYGCDRRFGAVRRI